MRSIKPILIAVLATSILPISIATASPTTQVRNCVDTKTGVARLISEKITKCRKNEKLIYLEIPAPDLTIVHSGTTPPVDGTIGVEGDFYIDKSANQIYGPLTNGLWGKPVNLAGPSGSNGNTVINGVDAPSVFVGQVGDFYIDTKASKLYGPKTFASGWGTPISLIGPAGATGPQGSTGPQGPTGATGPAGPAGANGTNGTNGTNGATGPAGGFGSYGSFYDATTVTLALATPTPVPLGSTVFASGISIAEGSKITMANAGKYNIAFSIQVQKTDNGTDGVAVWLRKNGNDVPWTNTDVALIGSDARSVLAWNFFVDAAAGDNFQVMIGSYGTGTIVKILSTSAAGTSPTRPQIPGTILTVNQVG